MFRCSRRFKGNIMPHRKPRWVPLADSTLLRDPPRDMAPEGEREQCNALHYHYHEHLSAITQYLYDERLRVSDVADAEAEAREQVEHERLLRENQEVNAEVARR